MRRRPGDGAPRAQRQRSHWFHMARVGHVVNPRRVGFGGLADREQTQVPRARRWRALRPAPGVARGPQCPRRPRRASHLSQRVGRARASSGASTHRAVRAPRARLYRSQILQDVVNMRWKALAEIYTMHSFTPLCNLKILPKKRENFYKFEILAKF